MIYKGSNKEVSGIFRKESATGKMLSATAVYKGLELVWTAILSCFGKGYWINTKPWVNTDGWKNNIG